MSAIKLFLYKKSTFLIAYIIAFLTPVFPFFVLTGAVITLDAFTGVKASIKKGEQFSSKRLKDTVTKGLVYQSALLIAHICDVVFKLNFCLTVIGGWIVFTELKSIDENYFVISGKRIFKEIINRLPNMHKEKNRRKNEK